MKVKVWGCRGSIPSPGQSTMRYGGNTTCLELRQEGGTVIVDAGSGIRLLGNNLMKENGIKDIFMILTHSHWDHLCGFPFFTPAYFPGYKIHVYGGPNAQGSLRGYLSHQMTAPFFPVDFSLMKADFTFGIECPNMGAIGQFEYYPIPLSHPNGGYGYKFKKNGSTFVFLTDNEPEFRHEGGLDRQAYLEFSQGADLLIHDAQYTDEEYKYKKGWGHSTFSYAVQFAIDAGVKKLGLFHHDPDRNDDDLDRLAETCREQLKKAGSSIECFAVYEGMEIDC